MERNERSPVFTWNHSINDESWDQVERYQSPNKTSHVTKVSGEGFQLEDTVTVSRDWVSNLLMQGFEEEVSWALNLCHHLFLARSCCLCWSSVSTWLILANWRWWRAELTSLHSINLFHCSSKFYQVSYLASDLAHLVVPSHPRLLKNQSTWQAQADHLKCELNSQWSNSHCDSFRMPTWVPKKKTSWIGSPPPKLHKIHAASPVSPFGPRLPFLPAPPFLPAGPLGPWGPWGPCVMASSPHLKSPDPLELPQTNTDGAYQKG